MLSTLSTLFRAGHADAEDALTNRHAATLLAQHLREARQDLSARKAATARLMARQTETARRRNDLGLRIARREDEVRKALAANDAALAEDLADDILKLEDKRDCHNADHDRLATQITTARTALDDAERRFTELTEQLRQSRDRGLTRQAARPSGPAGDPLRKAAELAATLKERDTLRADMDAAYESLNTSSPEAALDERVRCARLNDDRTHRRKALLKRIKGDRK